jgi:hypothetical protein
MNFFRTLRQYKSCRSNLAFPWTWEPPAGISSLAELTGVVGKRLSWASISRSRSDLSSQACYNTSVPRAFCAAHLIAHTDFDFLAPASKAFPHERKA